MGKDLEGNLPAIAKSLERIANILEHAPTDKLKIVSDLFQEEIQEIEGITTTLSPEELFVNKVEVLSKAFQDLVDSFTNGEAQNIDYMTKYPFDSFSIINLALSVKEWEKSIVIEYEAKKEKEGL